MPVQVTTKTDDGLTLTAYAGDAKTLLAFNLAKRKARGLAGFTIECRPHGKPSYYLQNMLSFEHPELHAQVASEPANSSINAPLHKFRWLHVPGSVHQGLKPFYGTYTYTVTPRYFDDGRSLQPLDPALSAAVDIDVGPFRSELLEIGFTRGYVQSQAFVNHFGPKANIRPKDDELLFDTSQVAGANAEGREYTYAEEYEWLGFTAREKIFALLDEVLADSTLRLDVLAYDLNEPDLLRAVLELAKQGRVRILVDNAALHHSKKDPKPEDDFEKLFVAAAKSPAEIKRGKFGRYAHDKVFVIRDGAGAKKVLTGSTNFSVTGFYVNSNHVLVSSAPDVAGKYAELFDTVWAGDAKKGAWLKSPLASEKFGVDDAGSPPMTITFAPHSEEFATELLGDLVARIDKEGKKSRASGSVLFAVMAIDHGTSPVYEALKKLHADDKIFSFGVSDEPGGIALYEPRKKSGVLVTGKPVRTQLPPPFNQVPGVGLGHQIHHKFVVCGFGTPDAVVYCGSSNLALGGEQLNGDNLIEIRDRDIVTVFAIEALALVDHFQFLDRTAQGPKEKNTAPAAVKPAAAASKGWFLSTSDRWAGKYFDPEDLYYVDRRLFG
jgi:hypothetical protein